LLRADYSQHVFAPHTHDGFMIGMITRGALEFMDDQSSYIAKAGQVVLCDPGWIHWGRAADASGWSINTVYVPISTLRALSNRHGPAVTQRISFGRIVLEDPALAKLINRAVLLRDSTSDTLSIERALEDVGAYVLRNHADQGVSTIWRGREHSAVKRVRKLIENRCLGSISLDEMSEEASLDKFWLIKSFKKQVGVTPHAYLVISRIERSKELLRDGMGLSAVALECGFSDQSHFSRVFKCSTGVTPGRFACI